MKEYAKKPNQKWLRELKDKCCDLRINFDQMHNKAKAEVMKEKAAQKLENPANLDTKLQKRIKNGQKLVEDLRGADEPAPYADSILNAARFNKMRIFEALVSYYVDSPDLRE
jgi:hypothetical protein